MKKTVDIIIPVFNEEENIEETIRNIKKNVLTPHRVLLIFDTEEDPTITVIKKLQERFSGIDLIKNKYGKGVVNALKTGFINVKAGIVVIMMADLSDNTKDIDKMIKKIKQGYEFVCASRYSKNGARTGGPRMKGYLSYLGCLTLRLITGIATNDATNAFKCFRKELLDNIKIESVGGFELPLELSVKAYTLRMKIGEVPTKWNERKKGNSKFKLMQWLPQYIRWYVYAISHIRLWKI